MSSSKAYLFSGISFFEQPKVALDAYVQRFRMNNPGVITEDGFREALEILIEHLIAESSPVRIENLKEKIDALEDQVVDLNSMHDQKDERIDALEDEIIQLKEELSRYKGEPGI